MNQKETKPETRLEYLRGELRAERISYEELHELKTLAAHIKPDDVELLEASGFPDNQEREKELLATFPLMNANGCHNKSCDNDGFCNACGDMDDENSEKFSVGDEVFWNDPDDGICSKYAKIIEFKSEFYVLVDRNGNSFEAFEHELS
jgi:hypothetical protein